MIVIKLESFGFKEGDEIHEWKILGPAFSRGRFLHSGIRDWAFVARCSCGDISVINPQNLKAGRTKSCHPCSTKTSKGNLKHGESGSRLYGIWSGMVTRCYNTSRDKYKDYGGRGITIWQEWLDDPTKFFKWARENGYRDDLEIDREKNHLGYTPENCRWVTRSVNVENRRSREEMLA